MVDFSQYDIDNLNRRRREAQQAAAAEARARRQQTFDAEVTRLRVDLERGSAPVDLIEQKVVELKAAQAAMAAAQDKPAEEERRQQIAARFGVRVTK